MENNGNNRFDRFVCFMWVLAVIWMFTRFKPFKRLCHNFMKWHIPEETEFFDGLSFHSKCKFCGKNIMQDSQGNWFTYE